MGSKSINDFTNILLKDLYEAQGSTGNLVFSGTSAYILLGILNFGCRGKTEQELKKVLNEDFTELQNAAKWLDSKIGALLTELRDQIQSVSDMHSILFHNVHIREYFVTASEELFGLQKKKVNFLNTIKAFHIMNGWVKEKSGGLIPQIFDLPLDADTTLVLINSLFFHQDWEKAFNVSETKQEPFFSDKGAELTVEMMHREGAYKIYEDTENHCHFLFIPYEKKDVYAVIVLPEQDVGLTNVLKRMQIHELFTPFSYSSLKCINLKLPKFILRNKLDLTTILMAHGVNDLFTKYVADISGITSQTGFVKNIGQASVLMVDEKGTKAAAVTAISCQVDGKPPKSTNFTVDRPFIFHVYLSSKRIVLFSAIITDPTIK